jgi:hypothetical protein
MKAGDIQEQAKKLKGKATARDAYIEIKGEIPPPAEFSLGGFSK